MMATTLVALIVMALPAWAGEKIVSANAENYIALGYSDNSSKQLAQEDACNDARRELIGYVFGAAYQIDQNMVRSIGVLEYSTNVSESSAEVIIRGATIETSRNAGTTKCVITYPINEANLEKERLKSIKNLKSAQFTEIGDSNDIRGGALEILSIPEDADVYVDNLRWGITPLRLNGQLSVGSHLIRIEKDDYDPIELKKKIGAVATTRVEVILKRATGKLRIKSDPEGATVHIDGQPVGYTPAGFLPILAGQQANIKVTDPDTYSTTQTVSLDRNEQKTVTIELQPKPSSFSIHVDPSGSTILLDNKTAVKPNQWVASTAGTHTLTISKYGYENCTTSFNLHGNEKKALATINLKRLTEEGKNRFHKTTINYESAFIMGFGLDISGANIPPPYGENMMSLVLTGEKRFLYRFGLRTKLGYGFGINSNSSSYQSAQPTLEGTSYDIGLPIYLEGGPKSFYLMPSFGGVDYLYKNITQSQGVEFNYQRKGITLGFQNQASVYNIYVSDSLYNWGPLGQRSVFMLGFVYNFLK